ncbi:arylsulfatase B-like [Palaemon carinicauda]|uniref:arylsulfatase B-like n=1 Tax=Palaemon carinicauda TaxID=392227 RepID=UPI0035B66917
MKLITCKHLLSTISVATFCTNTVASMSAEQVAAKKPHVIFIVADDLGWNDVSWNNPNVVMPYMNELAMNGVILNQSYLQPTCTPTRSALLTGKYPFKLGLQKGVIGSTEPRGVPLNVDMLPKLLKEINYDTHAIGKWHLGFCSWDYTPTKRGFDTFYGFYTAATDYYTHKRSTSLKPTDDYSRKDHIDGFLDLRNNTTPDDTKDGIYSTHLFGSVAEEIVRSREAQDPLFMYLAFQSVHSPVQVPQNYAQIYTHISNEERRNYLGMVTAMDLAIGRLVRALKETGHYNNSVIIFTTDNGGSVKNGGSNWPLRGEKSTMWEGGVRGPAFIHSPHLPNPGTVTNQLHHATDWFRTIIDITGGTTTDEVDGISQWDALAGFSNPPRVKMIHNMYYTGNSFKAGVRLENYKMLIGCMEKNSWLSPPPSADSPTNSNSWLPSLPSENSSTNSNGWLPSLPSENSSTNSNSWLPSLPSENSSTNSNSWLPSLPSENSSTNSNSWLPSPLPEDSPTNSNTWLPSPPSADIPTNSISRLPSPPSTNNPTNSNGWLPSPPSVESPVNSNSWLYSPPSKDISTNFNSNIGPISYVHQQSKRRNNNNNDELKRVGNKSNETSENSYYSFDDRSNNFFSALSCLEEDFSAETEGKPILSWKDLKNHSSLQWDPEVLWNLGQHMEERTKIRLYNIKDDPEERNDIANENIYELQIMLNYLSTQIPYMKTIPEKTKMKAGHPINWNNVWSPGWCQSEF